MAHYGRSEEEFALRGEECGRDHPLSTRASLPTPREWPRARQFDLTPDAALRAERKKEPPAPPMPPIKLEPKMTLPRPPIFNEGVEIKPGLLAKINVGRGVLIQFKKLF